LNFKLDTSTIATVLNDFNKESVSRTKPVINQVPLDRIIEELKLETFTKKGNLTSENLAWFTKKFLSFTTRLNHPGYLAHQATIPHYFGALGSLIDGYTNNGMSIYEMGPAAASIEYFMVNWFLEKVGWTPSPIKIDQLNLDHKYGAGALTHGGSNANLTALIAARSRIAPETWQKGIPSDLAILAPAGCHYSVQRAAGMIGIGQDSLYLLDVDFKGAIIPDKIDAVYQKVKQDKKRVMALVANSCSTAVGIFDPLEEIADFCIKHDIWFHVDGAHGASALLSETHKHRLKGIEKAHSITWDAHKMLQTPNLCTALLVRNHKYIDQAFEQTGSYIFYEKDQPGFDFINRTMECTKAALGLKLFMVVGALGEKGLSTYIDTLAQTATDAYEYISSVPEFTCPVKPQLNILCFKIKGSDALQIKIRDRILSKGTFHISSTCFNDVRYLRMSIMNPDTNMSHIKDLINQIQTIKTKMN
jgi:L-2,4-diaminobutyrate decarboxylase